MAMVLQGLHGVPAPDRLSLKWVAVVVPVHLKAFSDGDVNDDALHGGLELELEIGCGELHVVHGSLWQKFLFWSIGLVAKKCIAGPFDCKTVKLSSVCYELKANKAVYFLDNHGFKTVDPFCT